MLLLSVRFINRFLSSYLICAMLYRECYIFHFYNSYQCFFIAQVYWQHLKAGQRSINLEVKHKIVYLWDLQCDYLEIIMIFLPDGKSKCFKLRYVHSDLIFNQSFSMGHEWTEHQHQWGSGLPALTVIMQDNNNNHVSLCFCFHCHSLALMSSRCSMS